MILIRTAAWPIGLLGAALSCYSAAAAIEQAQVVPAEVRQALADADVPLSHVALLARPVGEPQGGVAWRAGEPMNPASVMKLLTTFAGLELLGPQYRWQTTVWQAGKLRDGTFSGRLVLRGGGDPRLLLEHCWLLLRELRLRGVRRIEGDVLLDRSAWQLPAAGADFDDTPHRPYHVEPDPLLTNFRTVRLTLLPQSGQVAVLADPALPAIELVNQLQPDAQPCGDWKSGWQVSVTHSRQITVSGRYRLACGERNEYVAVLNAGAYSAALLSALWQEMGGELTGQVIEGATPADARLWFSYPSPPLVEVIRDINKFSNNTQARLLYLTLGLADTPPGGNPLPAAGQAVRRWLAQRGLALPELVLENGAGLSRHERISAASLAALLDLAQASPLGAELESSLPLVASDGTMKRRLQDRPAAGRAHIKTGSLEGVRSIAGYVHAADGRKWVIVGIVNHPAAANANPALDRWIDWVAGQGAAPSRLAASD